MNNLPLAYVLLDNERVGTNAIKEIFDKVNKIFYADMQKCAAANNHVVLFNIDSKAKSDSKNKTQAIMDIMLRAFNESISSTVQLNKLCLTPSPRI